MSIAIGERKLPIGAVVTAIGGILAAVGAFLAWETLSQSVASQAGTGASMSGWDGGNGGKIVAVLGIVAIALAVAWILDVKLPIPALKFMGVAVGSIEGLTVVVGVLILFVGLVNFQSISSDVNDANAVLAGMAAMGVGLYLDLLAGALIVVGGVLGILKRTA
jgi:hypothetical protein